MSNIQRLALLLYEARLKARTIHAVVDVSADIGKMASAEATWEKMNPRRRVAHLGQFRPQTGQVTKKYEIWNSRDWGAWRVDLDPDRERKSLKSVGALANSQGAHAWWPLRRIPSVALIDPFVKNLMDPSALLYLCELSETGEQFHCGRQTISAAGIPRADVDMMELEWPYADQYSLLVDAQYGTLLKFEAIIDSVPFIRSEILEVEFDIELDSNIFLSK